MVSVIIPVYNCEKYITDCLDSVYGQSYQNLQIIVVDDGSTDDSFSVLKKYSAQNNNITLLHKENGGVSSARNLAMKSAKGDYMFFLDADDRLEENAIEILVKAMADGADIINCQYSRWDFEGKRLDDYNFIKGEWTFNSAVDRMDFATKELLNYYVGFEVWNKLYKTSNIVDNGIVFSEECSIGEDLAFNLKYLLYAHKLTCIEDRCVRYTVREDSAMGTLDSLTKKINESLLLLKDVRDCMLKPENREYLDYFPLICAKVLDNSFVGVTAAEAAVACEGVDNITFMADIYQDIENKKNEVIKLYPEDIAKIKFRYHMFVAHSITGFKLRDKFFFGAYDTYRRLRHRQILSEWKMPY